MSNRPDIVAALEHQEKLVDQILEKQKELQALKDKYDRFNIYDYIENSRETEESA